MSNESIQQFINTTDKSTALMIQRLITERLTIINKRESFTRDKKYYV